MTPETIIEDHGFQETSDKIRKEESYDFAAIAFYGSNKPPSPIRWHYVSGNKNNRFKLIILRKDRGLAGTVMETEKRMIIANVGLTLGPGEKIGCPTLLNESLTVVLAIPLQHKNQVCGVLLFGQRDGRSLPKTFGNDDIQHEFRIFSDDRW